MAAVNGNRPGAEGGNFPGYVPITTAPVVAKVSWPAGVPAGHDGVYGNFEYAEQPGYTQSLYQQY